MISKFKKWLNESITIPMNGIKCNFIVKINSQEEYWELMRMLDELGYSWGYNSKPSSHNNYSKTDDYAIRIDNRDIGYARFSYYDSNPQFDDYFFLDFKDLNSNIIKHKKIERPDIDPYGEDEWGYEEMNESSLFEEKIENVAIYVKTQDEYWSLMTELEKHGFTWVNDPPTSRNYFDKYPKLCVCIENKHLSYCNYEYFIEHDYNIINWEESIKNKKIKKIKRPEIDPYDEDEWGYEELD